LRELLTPWRWPLCLAAAGLLALLLAMAAARFYPAGDLSHLASPYPAPRPLILLGEVEIVDDGSLPAEPEPEREAPPPEPTLLRDLWHAYIMDLSAEATSRAAARELPPLLSTKYDLSFIAMRDTSTVSRLLWSARLQNAYREGWLREGLLGGYARKAGDFRSRKKLIFNESWLEDADVR
jgi:hypothetical protein